METNELPESEAGQQKPSVNTNQKILADLDLLLEKMDRCDSYLRPNGCLVESPVFKSEELLDVIGFLEACSPRMVELVEAATQGALSEQGSCNCSFALAGTFCIASTLLFIAIILLISHKFYLDF